MFKQQHSTISSIVALLTVLFLWTTPALAIHPEEKSDIENLKKRIEALESQPATSDQTDGKGTGLNRISKYVTLHGLLEAEATYAKPSDSEEESDLSLATAELSIEANLNEVIGGHVTLLYEEEAGEEREAKNGVV